MNLSEYIFGIALIIVLLGSAGYFAWRQKLTLRSLGDPNMLTPEDRLYVHKQVRRRMLCSVLMMALAGMLIGWFFIGGELVRQAPPPGDEQAKPDVSWQLMYVIAALFILFTIVILAIIDLMATARFGLRHQRRLENERRQMLETQAAILRRERNGER
jgi:MFS family permease